MPEGEQRPEPGARPDDRDGVSERIAAARRAVEAGLRAAAADAARQEAQWRQRVDRRLEQRMAGQDTRIARIGTVAERASTSATEAAVAVARIATRLERDEDEAAGEAAALRRRLLEVEAGAVESATRARRSAELAERASELETRLRDAAGAEARAAARIAAAELRLLGLVRRS